MGVGISQKKLAEKLGLSRATVSYVLNGKAAENRVPPETAERVLKAGRELGYVPNRLAQSLKQKRTGVIGYSIMDFRMDWTHRLYQGINEALGESDTVPLFAVRGVDPVREREEMRWMMERRADGLVVASPMQPNLDFYRDLIAKRNRLLFLSDLPEGMQSEGRYVLWDSPRAMAALVERVILSGRRRLAWIGSPYQEILSKARHRAFREVVAMHDVVVPESRLVSIPLTRSGFDADLHEWIQQEILNSREPVQAIICLNDETAAAVIPQLWAAGVRVPQDVVVTGIGNLPLPGSAFEQIVTVHEPQRELGFHATKAMLELIDDPDVAPVREVIDIVEIHDRSGILGAEATGIMETTHLPNLKGILMGGA